MDSGIAASPVWPCYLMPPLMVYLKSVSRLCLSPSINALFVVVVAVFIMGKSVFFLLLCSSGQNCIKLWKSHKVNSCEKKIFNFYNFYKPFLQGI